MSSRDIDSTSENVLHDWASEEEAADRSSAAEEQVDEAAEPSDAGHGTPAWGTSSPDEELEQGMAVELGDEVDPAEVADEAEQEEATELVEEALVVELSQEHAAGDLHIPDGYAVLE